MKKYDKMTKKRKRDRRLREEKQHKELDGISGTINSTSNKNGQLKVCHDRDDTLMDISIKWLSDRTAVRNHIEQMDLFGKLETSDGLIRIENVLPDNVAEAALNWVKNLPNDQFEVRKIDRKTSLRENGTTEHHFYLKNIFPSKQMTVKTRKRYGLFEKMITQFLRDLWPKKRCVFSVGKYNCGNYIAEHDDHAYVTDNDGTFCSRDLAVILYLTKGWTEEDGGILIDLSKEAGSDNRFVPIFNSMVAFEVPRFHEVTAVKPRQGRDSRYSIFGWFLEEGDIYSYHKIPQPSSFTKVKPDNLSSHSCSLNLHGKKGSNNSGRKKKKRKKRKKYVCNS